MYISEFGVSRGYYYCSGDGGDQPQGGDDGRDPYGPQVPEEPEEPRVFEVPNYGENEVAPMRQRDPLSAAVRIHLYSF